MRKLNTLGLLIPFTLLLASCGSVQTPTGTPKSLPATQTVDAGDQTQSDIEAQILKEVNIARAVARTCGGTAFAATGPVTWNGYLAKAARAYAVDMAAHGFFDHVTPDGVTVSQRVTTAGYINWSRVSENIAAGYSLSNVVQGWIDSPSHCKTLMDPNLKEVGIGYVYYPGSDYGTYWVQDYGTK